MKFPNVYAFVLPFPVLLGLAACGSSGDDPGTGGRSGTGGISGTGGANAASGSSAGTGGRLVAAGGTGSGGVNSSTGGLSGTGGRSGTGGLSGTGAANTASGSSSGIGGGLAAAGGTGSGGVSSGAGGTGDPTRVEIVHADFTARSVGGYSQAMIVGDFGFTPPWNNGLNEGRVTVVDEDSNKFLRMTYPAGQFGPTAGGVQFLVPFGQTYQELYFSYRVRFKAGFDFVKGGKLPGLVGGSSPTGCSPKKDGFSARNMWRTGGALVQYVYWPNQPETCGDDLKYMDGATQKFFPTGQWVTVEHRVKMNTAGTSNGVFQAWVNGVLYFEDNARLWRDTGATYGIDTLYFSSFFGGGDPSWAPAVAQVADFDDLIVADKPITH